MYHRKPEKYKEFEGMQNVVVGYGELIRVNTPQGVAYRTPSNTLIYDEDEAYQYAIALDKLIRKNITRIKVKQNRFKP